MTRIRTRRRLALQQELGSDGVQNDALQRRDEEDSDDEVTVGDDTYELDVDENFWEVRRQLRQQAQEEEEAEDEDAVDDDDRGTRTNNDSRFNSNSNSLTELLDGAKDFNFVEFPYPPTEPLPKPPKIFDQRSGIKSGVKDAIHTPFDAFRKSGFTEQLIQRWTKNSNK